MFYARKRYSPDDFREARWTLEFFKISYHVKRFALLEIEKQTYPQV